MDAKKKARAKLKEEMKAKLRKRFEGRKPDIQKVSVISDSPEGLEEGLEMAEEIVPSLSEKIMAARKGKKMADGGKKDLYELPEELKKKAEKMNPSKYEVPSEIEEEVEKMNRMSPKLSKLAKAFKNRKRK